MIMSAGMKNNDAFAKLLCCFDVFHRESQDG
jgi:hypothetical protein